MKRNSISPRFFVLALVLAGMAGDASPRQDVACGGVGYHPLFKTETVLFWNCPEKEKQVWLTNLFLRVVGEAYIEVERKVPRTMEEFLNSPYLPVALEDIRNPYQNRPVRWVPIAGYETFAGWTEARKREHLGDYLVYWSERAQALCLSQVFERSSPAGGESQIDLMGPCLKMPRPDQGWWKETLKQHQEGRFNGMDEAEKSVYAACKYLNNTGMITLSYYPLVQIPPLAERPRFHPLIAKLRNPYAGRAMRQVDRPSPGDYKVVQERGMEIVLCYNREAKLIQPQRWFYRQLQESERIRQSLGAEPDPEIQIPEGVD